MNSHHDPSPAQNQTDFFQLLVAKYLEIDDFFKERKISKPSFIGDLPFHVRNASLIKSVEIPESSGQNVEIIRKKSTPPLEFLRELDHLSDDIERNLKEFQRNQAEIDQHEEFDEEYKCKVRETIEKIRRNVGFLVADQRQKDLEFNRFLEEMEKKCIGLEHTKEKLAGKVEDQSKINELLGIIKKKEEELKSKDQQLIEWKSMKEALMGENENFKRKLEKKVKKIAILREELIPLREECSMLNDAIKTKQQEILKLKEDHEIFMEDFENITKEQEKKLRDELEEEKGKKEDLVRENMDKSDEIYNLMENLKEKELEIGDLKEKADRERMRFEEEKKNLEKGVKELEDFQERFKSLEEDLRFKTIEIVGLTEEISNKKRALNDLEMENTERTKEVENKISQLEEFNRKLQKENEELLKERDELTEKNVTFNHESMRMQEEKQKLEEEFTIQMRKLVEEKERLEKDLEIKNQSLEELQKHYEKVLEEKDLEIANHQFTINDMKKQELIEEKFNFQMRELVEEKERLQKDLEIKYKEMEGKDKEIANQQNIINDLKQQELKLLEDITISSNEVNRLSEELIQRSNSLEKSNLSNHTYSEEVKRTHHELEQVKNELRNMEQLLENNKLENDKAQQKEDEIKHQIHQRESFIASLQEKLSEKDEILLKETEQIKNELRNMEKLLEFTKSQLEKTQKHGETLQDQIKQNEQLITSLQETVSEKEEHILKDKVLQDQILNDLRNTEQHLETTKSQLNKTQKDAEDLQNQIQQNELHITSLQQTLSEKEEILLIQKEKYDKIVPEHLELKKTAEIYAYRFKDIQLPKPDQYDLVLHIDSLISKEGWNLTQSSQFNMESLLEYEFSRVAFVGRENSGKTFLLNQLSRLNLPSKNAKTNGLSLVATKNFIGLDLVGLQDPVYFNDEKTLKRLEMTRGEQVSQSPEIRYRMLNERTMTDQFVEDYILETCHIIVVMVGKLTQSEQKLIERISKKYKSRKSIFVVHNYSDLMDVADVEKRVAVDILQAFNVNQIKEIPELNVPVFIEEHAEAKIFEGPQKEKEERNGIVHLVLGFAEMESGNHYNQGTLDFLAKAIETHPEKEKFDFRASLSQFFEENHQNYLHFTTLPKSAVTLDLVADGKKMQITSENEFGVKNTLFNSIGIPMQPSFEVIDEKERYLCLIEIPDLLIQENLSVEINSRKKDDFGLLIVKGLKKKNGMVFCAVPLGPRKGIEKVNMESLGYKDGVLAVEVVKKVENEGNL